MWHRVRSHLSYANVLSTIAVFAAIGGSSYAAIALPRNSVGERHIKSRAVGAKELKRGAVASRALRNGSVRSRDLSGATRRALRGSQGPAGPPGAAAISLRAAINSGGDIVAGNATVTNSVAPNKRLVTFGQSAAGCVTTATLARNGGGVTVNPGPGRIVVAVEENRVAVETFTADGTPAFLPFNVIVAC